MPRPIDVQLRKTYFSLRVGVAALGILLPFVLALGGWLRYSVPWQPSMSAYYYATPHIYPPVCGTPDAQTAALPAGSMRNWFVGFLFAVGAMLFVNKGTSGKENVALSLAGLFAWGIAVCPMAWACTQRGKFSVHGMFAVLFFGAVAFVCIFCADDTLQFLDDPKTRKIFRSWYWFFAVVMVVSPLAAWGLKLYGTIDRRLFMAEACGVISFGAFWLVKSLEIAIITKQRNARGKGAASAMEAVPV